MVHCGLKHAAFTHEKKMKNMPQKNRMQTPYPPIAFIYLTDYCYKKNNGKVYCMLWIFMDIKGMRIYPQAEPKYEKTAFFIARTYCVQKYPSNQTKPPSTQNMKTHSLFCAFHS